MDLVGSQDLFKSGMVRYTDMDMSAMKGDVCSSHRSLGTGGTACHAGHMQ